MKNTLLLIIIASLFSHTLYAQISLADSRRGSEKEYIYTIDRENLRKIYLKEESPNENMLGRQVGEVIKGKKRPDIARGNYMIVSSEGSELIISDYTSDDLYFKIVPAEQVMLCLYDSLGNIIDNAVVKCGSKKLKYDSKTKTYNTKSVKDEQVLEVNNNGVYHYIEIEKNGGYYYGYKRNIFKSVWWKMRGFWSSIKNGVKYLFNPDECPVKNKYTGFVVFNKPKYKPGEIVKLKAYMAGYNGKPYDKAVDIRLYSYYPDKVDTTLVKSLEPYRPGMYEYQFRLTDSLNLRLDNNYTIALRTNNKKENEVSDRFRYEDYELKSVRFSMTTNKNEYARNDTVKLKLKATDENEMAVYDGKVDVVVTPTRYNSFNNTNKQQLIFVPDTLWEHTVDMIGVSEKELILPDSIFPSGISLNYQVSCTYLSADNEKRTQSKNLYRKASDYVIDYALDKGILTVKELYKGQSQDVAARITVSGENDEVLMTDSVMLPYSFPVPWLAGDIMVRTKNTSSGDYYFFDEDDLKKGNQLAYKFYRNNDSVFLKVENPANIPFWYLIRQKGKDIAEGYTTHLDYSTKDTKDGYSMQLSYLFAGEGKRIEESLPFVQKNISIDVSTPTSVYPGQKANVLVSVTDKAGKPVDNVDITAYSFTSKFDNYSMPNFPVHGTAKYAKRFENIRYEPDESWIYNKKADMTWQRWRNTMALDTIEYYKFLYPDTYYAYAEPTSDGSTQISPFVVIDGVLQGVHMLWIDERLYYVKQAQQLDVYTFRVNPGKHNLKFRTYDREILVHGIDVEKGMKNIISFDAGKPYTRIDNKDDVKPFVLSSRLLPKKERGYLTESEAALLQSQLIMVDNNFGWLELPNNNRPMDLPAYIATGNNFYYLNHMQRNSYNYRLKGYVSSPVLAGPFPTRNFMNGLSNIASVYADGKLITNTEIEGGNKYTLYKDFQKIKPWDKPDFSRNFSDYTPVPRFREQLLSPEGIRQQFNNRLSQIMSDSRGFAGSRADNNNTCRLKLGLDRDIKPSLIFFVPKKKEDVGKYQLYYGGSREFSYLPAGSIDVVLVFRDSTSCTTTVDLHPRGQNYLNLDSIKYDADNNLAKVAFRLFNRGVKRVYTPNPYTNATVKKDSIMTVPPQDISSYKQSNANKGVVTGVVLDSSGDPLIAVSVSIQGTTIGTLTDLDGRFELPGGAKGDKITFAYVGFITKTVKYSEGHNYNIVLEEDSKALEEVVVVGYGTAKKSNMTGAIIQNIPLNMTNELQGRVAGIMIRGTSSGSTGDTKPLILVNGLPFDGNMEDLDPNSITSLNMLKDASATALYGARAANGVIMIQTNAPVRAKTGNAENESPSMEPGNSMRRNFHDDAFWQPRLRTDAKGEASFEVTYPDDITSWNAYFIAVGDKKQTDKKQMTIKSFKALTARLSMPRFAIRGDSLNAVGRISNHLGDSIQVERRIEASGQDMKENMKLAASHVDYIPVKSQVGDSISATYSLQMANGYFDGEERSIPVFEQGMLQTHGDFKVISDTATHILNIDPALGTTTIHAEASSLEMFLREIDKVDNYPYMCNEQMASKIKVLLSKKHIAKIFGKEFKDDKKINNLISRLNRNKNVEGFWGWWNKDKTEVWISKQIISAMLDAEDAGYKTNFNKNNLKEAYQRQLENSMADLKLAIPGGVPFAKQELLDRLITLKRLDAQIDYKLYFKEIDGQLKNRNLTDRLKTMLAMSVIGMKDEIVIDSLMKYAHKTILGSMYWGEGKEVGILPRAFILPYNNNTENTLIAYNILKNIGGYETELEKIRQYFFERRQGGSWLNTYESSRIIEAIMPDMLKDGTYSEVSMFVNGKKVTKFPYTDKMETTTPVSIRKEGTAPLFVTAYQQEWNNNPVSESSKGFNVRSYFTANKDTVSQLVAGKTAQLEVIVNIDADAEYVQIEVPVPAGCSYETKGRGSYWKEVHREYFKEKVVIFSNKLTKGEHKFTIELIPRYTGLYSLNPAKAELMYFPTFYGNEEIKKVAIKE